MSDTTITPEEREMWARTAAARINAVTPERQCEITAQERLVKALQAIEQAEARAKDNSNALTAACMSGKYDGRKEAEANVARLTKMVDWLAAKLSDCPPEFTNCAVDCAECRKEAARRVVADSEVTGC